MSLYFWKIAFTLLAIFQLIQAWEFGCYNGSLSDYKSVSYENVAELISSGHFNVEQKVMVHAHGYRGNTTTQGTDVIVEAFLRLQNRTVCVIDWPKEANLYLIPFANFFVVSAAAKEVANEVAEALKILYENGMKPENVHMTGLSLGAHLVGIAGRRFQNLTNLEIARVTGFEPAKPGFEGPFPGERIDQTSATFVDIIHTDWDRYGLEDPVGHIDFYLNPIEYASNGVQPGCPKLNYLVNPPLSPGDACSHRRALNVYVDSMVDEGQLQGAKAASEEDWAKGITEPGTFIGEGIDQSIRGKLYLRTNGQPPYGLGEAGQMPPPTS